MLFILVPLSIAAVTINSKASGVLSGKTYEKAYEVLRQTRFGLENMIKQVDFLSLTILSDDNMQRLLKQGEEFTDQEAEITKQRLYQTFDTPFHSLLASRQYIDSISVSKDKTVIFQYGARVLEEDTRFHEKALSLKGIPFWTSVYEQNNRVIKPESANVVSLYRAINDMDRTVPLAVERITILEETLSDLLNGVNLYAGGRIFILDTDGIVMSSPDKSLLGQKVGNTEYGRRASLGGEGYFKASVEGANSLVSFYTLPDTGWHIVQIIPTKALTEQISIVNQFVFLCLFLCLVFGFVYYIVQDRSIVVPLKKLYVEMSKVKNGDFQISLDTSRRDELGRVSFLFVEMIKQLEALIENEYKGRIREREAELKALQAQINPHFLYNTLDSIRWLAVKNKDYEVGEQIEVLSDLFRHVLNRGEETTTLKNELSHLSDYLFIQKMRFGDKISFHMDTGPDLDDCEIPKLILQPIVENAIVHGLEGRFEGGAIKVTVLAIDGKLICIVEDDGVGTDAERLNRELALPKLIEGSGYGLRNIQERIRLRYGSEYGMSFQSEQGKGTKVILVLPLLKPGGEMAG